MRKRICLLLALTALLLSGCGGQKPKEPRLTVVATVFPAWDWTRQILGDCPEAELIYLAGSGVDLHSYQLTAEDMVTIAGCDLFLYVGGESDAWVEDALRCTPNPGRQELSLLEVLEERLHEEETVEGMQVRAEEEEEAYDEHVWLSLQNAREASKAICDALCTRLPEEADRFRENLRQYDARLAALEEAYRAAAEAASCRTLLFCDRFPFRYLTEDYHLAYYAAFSGCSGDSEASFATVLFLAEKAEELGLTHLLILEDSDERLAQTVAGCMAGEHPEILRLDSMQSVSLEEASEDYALRMEKNLAVLTRALR